MQNTAENKILVVI